SQRLDGLLILLLLPLELLELTTKRAGLWRLGQHRRGREGGAQHGHDDECAHSILLGKLLRPSRARDRSTLPERGCASGREGRASRPRERAWRPGGEARPGPLRPRRR